MLLFAESFSACTETASILQVFTKLHHYLSGKTDSIDIGNPQQSV
jgi:hypothetical protein